MANKYVKNIQPHLVIKYIKMKQQSEANFAYQINNKKQVFLKKLRGLKVGKKCPMGSLKHGQFKLGKLSVKKFGNKYKKPTTHLDPWHIMTCLRSL